MNLLFRRLVPVGGVVGDEESERRFLLGPRVVSRGGWRASLSETFDLSP